jgi:hypothetical protein
VAVKIVSKKKLSEEDLAALYCEIKILENLDHPHIIKCVLLLPLSMLLLVIDLVCLQALRSI